MATINIAKQNETIYEVTVTDGTSTSHIVTVPPDYAANLTGGRVSVETLVRRSFDFLLERESNTSILRRFELPLIAHYFPEYERTIRGML
jgi:hypothetical protein